MMQKYVVALALLAAVLPGAARAQATEPGWSFAVTPYLWAPSIDGKLRYGLPPGSGGGAADVRIDNVNLLEALNGAAMVAAEARNGRVSILTDLIYLSLGNAGSKLGSVDFAGSGGTAVSASLNRGTETTVRGGVAMLAGGYTLAEGAWGNLDAIGGLRLFDISARTDVRLAADIDGPRAGQSLSRTAHLSRNATLVDGIAGLRGRIDLGSGFHLPYSVDAGTGASRVTWQAIGGVGYQTGWAGVTLGYRHLYYDQGGSRLVQDFAFSGPFLAVRMRF